MLLIVTILLLASMKCQHHFAKSFLARLGRMQKTQRCDVTDVTWPVLFESAVKAAVEIDRLPCGLSL